MVVYRLGILKNVLKAFQASVFVLLYTQLYLRRTPGEYKTGFYCYTLMTLLPLMIITGCKKQIIQRAFKKIQLIHKIL